MTTLTATHGAATYPAYTGAGGGNLCAAYGTYTLAANPAATTIIVFCKVPAGAVVLGGFLRGEDIDTGTEELDIDIGWAANGAETADPDGFGNFGVITGDVVTEWKPEVSILLPLNGVLKSGPVTFTRETLIQAVVNVDAATGGTGVLWLQVQYIVP